MRILPWCSAFVLAASVVLGAEETLPKRIFDETPAAREARLRWWRHDRFGMFIHFGLYALPARQEWVRTIEQIPRETYDRKYFDRFNPDLFDAKEWAKAAKAAGMRYVVLTTKHHEGFCLWDTRTTDYKITKTPFGRDLVREFVDAVRAEGLRVGFYFSIIDWHHPDFAVDVNHPDRPAVFSKTIHDIQKGCPGESYRDVLYERFRADYEKANEGRDMNRYRAYMHEQVRELMTNYGKVDIVWFDFTNRHELWGKTWRDWDAVELLRMTRRLQPGVIVDNRLDLMDTEDGWDFVTPEQFKVTEPPTVRGRRVPWETCQTFSGSWGYARDEMTWKSMPQLIELLTETVSKDGNLILNVGPTARGKFDKRAQKRLAGFAEWMELCGRSVYGCTEAPAGFVPPTGTALTYNPETKRLYVHLYDYPMEWLPLRFWDRVEYAQFLHDGSELAVRPPRKHSAQMGEQRNDLGGLILPVVKPDIEVPVVELWLKERKSE